MGLRVNEYEPSGVAVVPLSSLNVHLTLMSVLPE